jgi:hypothetical protein
VLVRGLRRPAANLVLIFQAGDGESDPAIRLLLPRVGGGQRPNTARMSALLPHNIGFGVDRVVGCCVVSNHVSTALLGSEDGI